MDVTTTTPTDRDGNPISILNNDTSPWDPPTLHLYGTAGYI